MTLSIEKVELYYANGRRKLGNGCLSAMEACLKPATITVCSNFLTSTFVRGVDCALTNKVITSQTIAVQYFFMLVIFQ